MTAADKRFFASAWFKSRPPAVQGVFRKYQGKPISLEGFEEPHYLTGVSEEKDAVTGQATGRCGLWVSTTRMEDDYERAMATKFNVCSCCLKKVHIPTP